MMEDPDFATKPILYRIETITIISIGRRTEDDHFDYKEVARDSKVQLMPGEASLAEVSTFLAFFDKEIPKLDETETPENYLYNLLRERWFAEVHGLDWELVKKLIDRGIDVRTFRRACWPRGSILTLDQWGSKYVRRRFEGSIAQLTDEDLDAHDWESFTASESRFEREIAESRRKIPTDSADE